jgi:hypothetical protein
MSILRVCTVRVLNFKSSRSLLFFFSRAARALLFSCSLEFGGIGEYDSEDRRIFSDLSQTSTTSEHGFYVRARRASTEASAVRWVMTIEVMLKAHSPMHSEVVGLRLVEARR